MKKYIIQVKEVNIKVIELEAESWGDAMVLLKDPFIRSFSTEHESDEQVVLCLHEQECLVGHYYEPDDRLSQQRYPKPE